MLTALVLSTAQSVNPVVDEAAPAFSGVTAYGEAVSLADYAGQTVILEWTNHECPYVVKQYSTGNMQSVQQAARADGIVWLSVISSAEGKQGYVEADQALAIADEAGADIDGVILDPSGEIGRAYAAKTSPHMFVIDGEGVLRYDGAIDDHPTANPAGLEDAVNYVRTAMAQMAEGADVDPDQTQPYGCSVKYADS